MSPENARDDPPPVDPLEELRAAEARWRSLVENNPDFVILTDRDSTVRYINRAHTGRVEDIIGRQAVSFVFSEYREEVLRIYARVWDTGETADFELPVHTLDGSSRWFFARLAAIRQEGKTTGLVVVSRDLTERKRSEQKLAESESRFRTLAESIDQVFWFASPTHDCVQYVSPAFERLWGVSAEALYQDQWLWIRAIHPEDRPRIEQALSDWVAGRQPTFDEEYRIVRPDGSVRHIVDTGAIVRDDTGAIKHFSGIARDITQRVQSEEALREREARLRALLSAIPDLIFVLDREGRYLECYNNRHEHFLGPTELLLGRAQREFLPPELGVRLDAALVQALDSGQLQSEEYSLTVRDQICWYEVRYFPYQADRALALVRDISDRHREQQARAAVDHKLQETQKLESLGVLAGGIAHDFNNLLTGILGNANLARLEVAPGSPGMPYLEQIEKICQRAAELCKQMLAYAGKGRFVVEPIDLGQLVTDITHLMQLSIAKTSFLNLNLARNLPPVLADGTQMRQVVMNLVINASEACGDSQGVIGITTGLVHLNADYKRNALLDPELPERDYVFLEVSDNGSGMTEDVRARIFDPFFTTKFTGRGLGLAAVQGIVRAHRGAIKVYSEPGQGSTFKVLLPCAEGVASPKAPTGEPHPAAWRGDGTVLVVDDDERVRIIAVRMLEAFGFQIVEAADGQEALDCFRSNPDGFRLVLLDLTMPRMNGEEAFREIRTIRPDQRVILMTGYSATEVTNRFAGKGLAGFLQKPFHMAELLARVRSALGGT
jgi:two-component system cell cycle sensor histidine kinase/response regulator CckA